MDNKIDEDNNLIQTQDNSQSSCSIPNSDNINLTTILSELFYKTEKRTFIGIIKDIKYIILLFKKIPIEKDVKELESCLSILSDIFYYNPQIIVTMSPINNKTIIYDLFIDCYINLNYQEKTNQIITLKYKILELLRIVSQYIDCPYETLEYIYQKISSLTFRRNDTPNLKNNITCSSDIFIGYLELLKTLYNLRDNTSKPLKKMPKNYIIKNKTGLIIQPENSKSKIMLTKEFTIIGWVNINTSIQHNSEKKYLFQIETKDKSRLEVYYSENWEKICISYKKEKIEKKAEELVLDTNSQFDESNWKLFNFQIEKERSKTIIIITFFNCSIFEKPIMQDVQLELESFKQEAISNIIFYNNLICSFTSLIIGIGVDLNKFYLKENRKLLHYGIYNEKQYRILINKLQLYKDMIYDIFVPYKAIINNETKEIQFKGDHKIFKGVISSSILHLSESNYSFCENIIHSYNKYSSTVFFIGGINSLLPLLEIISTQKDIIQMDCVLFENVFNLITKLVTKSKLNFISAILNDFFPALSVFMENIPKKYFSPTICQYILDMQKYYLANISYIDNFFHGKIKKYNVFFEYIFLNERIIFRFENHLVDLILVEIKEMLNEIFLFLYESMETQERKENIEIYSNKQKKLILSGLKYEHLNYILNYEKVMSMLLYYESKTINKHCCQNHSGIIHKNKQNKKEDYLKPELSKYLEQIQIILCLLIKTEHLFHRTELLEVFKLISLDVSLCLKLFLIKLFPSLLSDPPITDVNNFIQALKNIKLITYLNIALSEVLLSEKRIILHTIICLDKINIDEYFVDTISILPLIKEIIPIVNDEEKTNEQSCNIPLCSSSFQQQSNFYNYYSHYQDYNPIEFYDFPQWISFFYSKLNIIKNDKYDFELDKLYEILFDWLDFWVKEVQKDSSPKKQCYRKKKDELFTLLTNYVIRIKHFDMIKKHINVFEKYLQQKKENDSIPVRELTSSQLFWLFIYEIYYHCFHIKSTNTQSTLIGDDKWFKPSTPIEEVDKTLDDICDKCHNIIQQMVTSIFLSGNDSVYLYYILTWGTYQKILHQSTEDGQKFQEKSIEILSTFMYNIITIYYQVLKKTGLTLTNITPDSHNYTATILTIIYDFVIIFPIGTESILDPYGILEYQTKSLFYVPGFVISRPLRIKEYSPFLDEITLFIMDFFETSSIFSRDPQIKENKSYCHDDTNDLLKVLVDHYIYKNCYEQKYYNRLLLLTKTDNFNIQFKDLSITYLSFPLVKIVMHFLCFLATINEEDNLNYLKLISMFLIDIITMNTSQNNKKIKLVKSSFIKEINKAIEPVILLGFIFLIEQSRIPRTNKEEYSKPLMYLLCFINKILTNKNIGLITQSPVFNIFSNILQDEEKNSFINLIKTEQFIDIEQTAFEKIVVYIYDNFIIHNDAITEGIKDYFGKEETLKHLLRIHCEIKNIIPIVNNINPQDIIIDSFADIFKIQTNMNSAISDGSSQMNRYIFWEVEKTNIRKSLFSFISKLERKVFLICKHNKKIYKNIKKSLFSWRGMWSNKDIFYNHPENLKQKTLYHLTKDFTTPLLIPILDMDLYLPTFRHFNIDNLFIKDMNNNTTYEISLDTEQMITAMKNKSKSSSNSNGYQSKHISKIKLILRKNFAQNLVIHEDSYNACMIKQTHHLPGIITIENKSIFFEYCYYESGSCIEENNLLYDKENQTCFGSFFKNYKKDKLKTYLRIPFSSINMIFQRKYYYCDNSFELFTDNNKSYYFHLQSNTQRQELIEQITEGEEFKIIMRNSYKKDPVKLLYINKKYQNRFGFKGLMFADYVEYWNSNKISNLEFIMFCNLLAGRSLRDLTQYPVFPWTLIDYESKELTFKQTSFRNFSLPMGMLRISKESTSRKDLFIQEYEQMEKEAYTDDTNEFITDNGESETNNMNLIIQEPSLHFKKTIKFEEFQNIPYFYGTHFSNPLYVSHYLSRIFPFSQLRVELQGDNFDSSRLFSSIQSTFISATTQKTDVRELIPEFFILPEMFVNINNIDLGQAKTNVKLPKWSNNKPYLFVKLMRKSIEYCEDSCTNAINQWLDLLIGSFRIGNQAKEIGNIYMFHTYASLIQFDLLKSREELNQNTLYWVDFYLRLVELGITPQVLINEDIPFRNPIYFKSISCSPDIGVSDAKRKKIYDIFDSLTFKYISINMKDKQIYGITTDDILCTISIASLNEDKTDKINLNKHNPFTYLQIRNFSSQPYYKLPILIKQYTIIQGCFWDETLLFQNKLGNNISITTNTYDNSIITVLTCDYHDKFGFCGTQKGSVLIYSIHYIQIQSESMFRSIKKKEVNRKEEWIFKTSLNNHTSEITAITINDNLDIMGSTAKDGYVHLYIKPSFNLVRSVKLTTIPYSDYLFISNSPVPCFVLLYERTFVSYTINGNSIEIDNSIPLTKHSQKNQNVFVNNYQVTSYYSFTDTSSYIQYLMIGTSNGDIHIREFPEMKLYSYDNIFNNCSIDAIIPLTSTYSEFLLYTRSENTKQKYKIIFNSKAQIDQLINTCTFPL